jgi:hypothetical protein
MPHAPNLSPPRLTPSLSHDRTFRRRAATAGGLATEPSQSMEPSLCAAKKKTEGESAFRPSHSHAPATDAFAPPSPREIHVGLGLSASSRVGGETIRTWVHARLHNP